MATTEAVPDYRWELRRVVLEGEWLLDAPGDGARVETREFDIYRVVQGLIVEVEGKADNARLRQ